MAQKMGGDLVLQLLQEFRESQVDYQQFKQEIRDFKQDMLGFKQEMRDFKQDMLGFKQEMMSFKEVMEVRMDLMQQTTTEILGYLKHIVKMLQSQSAKLADHEQRLTGLEGK